jgi:hypothetical protein
MRNNAENIFMILLDKAHFSSVICVTSLMILLQDPKSVEDTIDENIVHKRQNYADRCRAAGKFGYVMGGRFLSSP